MRVVRSLLEGIQRYSIELRVVRSLFGECEVFDRVGGCKEIVRRNVRYLIELRCKEFVRRILRYSIELRVVRRILLTNWTM